MTKTGLLWLDPATNEVVVTVELMTDLYRDIVNLAELLAAAAALEAQGDHA